MARVGMGDNFFHLGGDSISSIQLVGRARQGGAGDYAARGVPASDSGGTGGGGQAVGQSARRYPTCAVGALSPTPIMRWLVERGGPIERFHQAMLLRVPAGMQEDHLGAALQAMLDHHDALRLRLAGLGEAGEWTLEIAPAGTVAASSCLRRVDSGELEGAALRACIAEQARAAESGLSPGSGVMLQAVWFDAGPRRRAGCC